MTLTLDQVLQHASKFHRMYNNKVKVPLVIRTPMGGYRGYGPTHSQSLVRFFLGVPDLTVISLNHTKTIKNILFTRTGQLIITSSFIHIHKYQLCKYTNCYS